MRSTVVTLLALAALAGAACSSGSTSPARTPRPFPTSAAGLATTTVHAGPHAIPVEVAATAAKRAQGLGDRDSLPEGAGMLFDMERDVMPAFWMKGMRFALDLVWVDAGRRVIGVTPNVPPQPGVGDRDLHRYKPPGPVRYVIEVNAGAAQRLGLVEGTQLSFDLPPRAPTPAS